MKAEESQGQERFLSFGVSFTLLMISAVLKGVMGYQLETYITVVPENIQHEPWEPASR